MEDKSVSAESQPRPHTDSADGKLNGYIHTCGVVQQSMYYAACLSRLNALDQPKSAGVFVPQDWQQCAQACRSRTCQAQKMLDQEKAENRAIYFIERGVIDRTLQKARSWISSWTSPTKPKDVIILRASKSMLDAMGDSSKLGYADALGAPAPAPTAPVKKATAVGLALPGETPLQMARRLAAAAAARKDAS